MLTELLNLKLRLRVVRLALLNHTNKMRIQFNCGLSWRKILALTTFTSVVLILINLQYFSCKTAAKIAVVEQKPNDKSCIYTPSDAHYLLRLKPKAYNVPPLEDGDYKKLINLTNFEFQVINRNTCVNTYVFLLVLVTSAAQNHKRRHTIRTTWGQSDAKVKTLFMLGAVHDPNLQNAIEKEHDQYGDIVQGNFIDSYTNLTYKSTMALKYVVYLCPSATYILKTDDDVFVNMPLMKNYLTNDLSPFGAENYLQCHVMRNIPILRGNWSKWSVSEEEFPGKMYPTYCNGPYVLFSPDVLFKIYKQAQKTKFFFIEDVFLYGLAAGKYPEINHTDIRKFSLWKYGPYKLSQGAFDKMNFLIGTFGMNVEQLLEFWNYVTNRPVPSSVYDHGH